MFYEEWAPISFCDRITPDTLKQLEARQIVKITTENIENYRGSLTIGPEDLRVDMWEIFDKNAFDRLLNGSIIPLELIISTKNQLDDPKFVAGLKQDPRKAALEFMILAADGKIAKRESIQVTRSGGKYYVIDGNATAQVLMLAQWISIPVEIAQNTSIADDQ